MNNTIISAIGLFIIITLFSFSCQTSEPASLPKVKEADLSIIDPNLFSEDESFFPYYLKHFAAVANSIVDTGATRGFFNLSVWRGTKNHHPYNARIMEGILSLVWFYCTDKPWNPYYNEPALKKRIEASLEFWCKIQNEDGQYSEYGVGKWTLAPTAFATKFVGKALWLLNKGSQIDKDIFEKSKEALRKAVYIGFTNDRLWEHGRNYTNQFANLWGGALLYLEMSPDAEIEGLLKKRMYQSMVEFQSPLGFFYEAGGPDWQYNLSTHHSDLQVAWEYADEEVKKLIVEKTKRWYDWFSYNAVKEPSSMCYFLNRAVETRQQKGYYLNVEVINPAVQRWVPQAEFVPVAQAFEMSIDELENSENDHYQKMLTLYPKVPDLEVGEFRTFSPYAFLHLNMKMWHPSNQQKKEAILNLPYLKNDDFVHVKTDSRSSTNYSYIRKPSYYSIFNSGKKITKQQNYGLGLIWNPQMGTVFQSQSKTEIAAYGTKAGKEGKVYEADDIIVEFSLNGKKITPEEGSHDFNSGRFEVEYSLGESGHKKISFLEDGIKVEVKHKGDFTEVLPLLIDQEDDLTMRENRVTIKNSKGEVEINFSLSQQILQKDFESDLLDKSCKVLEINGNNKMSYEIRFIK